MKNKTTYLTVGALLFALAVTAQAQQPGKLPRIGFLVAPSQAFFANRFEAFRQGLRELGYVEGKNINIEVRYADGKRDRLSELAAELVHLNVDVIVASGPGSLAAKSATKTIPIVFAAVQDPITSGLVESLARPGGNVTGLSTLAPELGGKRLEILKEAVAKISRIAFLWGTKVSAKETLSVAPGLGVQLQSFEVRGAKDLDSALDAATKQRAQAMLMSADAFFNTHQSRIIEFAAKARLPAMYASAESVDAGGLMSYGPNQISQFHRAATYVDKILKGTKPADLPVEQPMKLELLINLKAAKQIGVTISPNVLARADRVIR